MREILMDRSLANLYERDMANRSSLLKANLMLQRTLSYTQRGMSYPYRREQRVQRRLFKRTTNFFKAMSQSFFGLITMSLAKTLQKLQRVCYHLERFS